MGWQNIMKRILKQQKDILVSNSVGPRIAASYSVSVSAARRLHSALRCDGNLSHA
jgi:hypothetical protein